MTLKPTKDWYIGLIMGLLLGIIGNLFTEYLMKFFESLNSAPWIWGVSAFTTFLVLAYLIRSFWKQAQKADS
jgi:uncharacterized membrane protein YeaQ/YmgE (transglycosylase-associated protein family)